MTTETTPTPEDVAIDELALLMEEQVAYIRASLANPMANSRTVLEVAFMSLGAEAHRVGLADIARWASNGVENEKRAQALRRSAYAQRSAGNPPPSR